MYDLFFALCTMDLPRGHPAVMAMLYSYCPAAAGWWAEGLELKPRDLPYNAAWQVLSDYASGVNLSAQLEKYGLKDLPIAAIQASMARIEEIRGHNRAELAPELHEDYIAMDPALRFGLRKVFTEHFGGEWRNTFEYARVWIHVLPNWIAAICHGGTKEFVLERRDIVFQLPKTRVSILFPTFIWYTDAGKFQQPSIGLLADGAVHNQFRSVLAMMSAPAPDRPWEAPPRVYALDPVTGRVNPFKPIEPPEQLMEDFSDLGAALGKGPFPPLAAFADPAKCEACIFRSQCYRRKGQLGERVRRLIAPGKSRQGPTE